MGFAALYPSYNEYLHNLSDWAQSSTVAIASILANDAKKAFDTLGIGAQWRLAATGHQAVDRLILDLKGLTGGDLLGADPDVIGAMRLRVDVARFDRLGLSTLAPNGETSACSTTIIPGRHARNPLEGP